MVDVMVTFNWRTSVNWWFRHILLQRPECMEDSQTTTNQTCSKGGSRKKMRTGSQVGIKGTY